jgi:hypothetical protein
LDIQLSFFRRGLKCLEALEPHVKTIAEKQHIDYQSISLEDNESDNDGSSSYKESCSDDGELSFDYEINDREQGFIASRGSMDVSYLVSVCLRFSQCHCFSSGASTL